MRRYGFILLCIGVLTGENAHAYIDPGTGATFVGSMAPLIIGAVSAVFAFILKTFWLPLKSLFVRGDSSKGE